jgi:hypothetical protein
MKQWLASLFSEAPGVSETRVMAMMICLVGCYVVIDGMLKPVIDYTGIATLSGALFTIAMGGKVMSKYAEVADHKANTTTKTTEINNA